MAEEHQRLLGLPVLVDFLWPNPRPLSRWRDFVASLSDRVNREMETVFVPSIRTGIIDGTGKERTGCWCVLYQRVFMIDGESTSNSTGLVTMGRAEPFWDVCWEVRDALRKGSPPLDLEHSGNVDRAMSQLYEYGAWSAAEGRKAHASLKEDIAEFMRRDNAAKRENAADSMADALRALSKAATETFGGIQDKDALRRVEAKNEKATEVEKALVAHRLNPSRANTATLESLRRDFVVPNDGGPSFGG